MSLTVYGKSNISATIIADSISPRGVRMTTFELEYPRFILAELNTHRMLSKNSASSRAIPVKAMHESLKAAPVFWGKNQPGMAAAEEMNDGDKYSAANIWVRAKEAAIEFANALSDLGSHKQITNRITEPFMMMKSVVSGTEWANLIWLRDHPAAQPDFRELVRCIVAAFERSNPTKLNPGEWHLPYVKAIRSNNGALYYQGHEGEELSLENARIVSASCCAQVSYRKNDDTLEKALRIYSQLIESSPAHASPVEHQATPMPDCFGRNESTKQEFWSKGITHIDLNNNYWSGNLRGWIQFRKLIPNEAVWSMDQLDNDTNTDSI